MFSVAHFFSMTCQKYFHEKTLQTIKDSAEKWRQLDGVEREVGVKTQLSDVHPGPLCTAGFTRRVTGDLQTKPK